MVTMLDETTYEIFCENILVYCNLLWSVGNMLRKENSCLLPPSGRDLSKWVSYCTVSAVNTCYSYTLTLHYADPKNSPKTIIPVNKEHNT